MEQLPYERIVAGLPAAMADAQIGETVLANFDNFDAKTVAAELRLRLQSKSLADVILDDVRGGRVMEAGGWVLPETLALLCALAAKAEA